MVHPNKKTNIKFKYIYNKGIEFSVDNNIQVRVEMKNKTLGYSESPHIIFGAGNFPKNNFNLNTEYGLAPITIKLTDFINEFLKYRKILPKKVTDIYRLRDYVSLKLSTLGI